MSRVAALIVSAILSGFTLTAPVAWAADDMARISVTGRSEVRVVPDLAVLSLGVQVQDQTAVAAMSAASSLLQDVFAQLDELGIAAEDMRTDTFSLNPVYSRESRDDGSAPTVVGYQVSNMVQVTVRDVDGLGAAVDRLAQAGVNTFNGISFSVSDPDAHMDDLRREAVLDARHKAEIYAAAAGVSLGKVLSLSDSLDMGRPQPMYARMEMASDMPIASGTVELGDSVTMVFEIVED